MREIDQTNIYTYKGKDFASDLKVYLTSQGAEVHKVEVVSGWIEIGCHPLSCKVPQYMPWYQIVRRVMV